MASQEPRKLQVGIIGAGIAGLASAIGLARAGHEVDVYEKSSFNSEVGAAINVCPNATRILRRWGFPFDQWGPTIARGGKVVLADGKIVSNSSYDHIESVYGEKYYLFHRVDLHSGLKELAKQSGARILPSNEVTALDCATGQISLKNGETVSKDAVVIADGVHSRFVSLINEDTRPAERTGVSMYRWLAPIEELKADPKTRPFVESSEESGLTIRVVDPETRLVCYPCRNGTVMNFGGIHPESQHQQKERLVEDYTSTGDVSGLVDTYHKLGEAVTEVCRKATDLKLWPLMYREPLQKWSRGRAILVGDAAHPMLPHQGQGGCQAIEDGAALEVMLGTHKNGDDVNDKLAKVEHVRKWRASAIQYMSNAGQDQSEETADKVRQVIRGREPPKSMKEIHDFNFGYDVTKESEEVLAKL